MFGKIKLPKGVQHVAFVLIGAFFFYACSICLSVVVDDRPPQNESLRERYLYGMQTRLQLSADQMSSLSNILSETSRKFGEHRPLSKDRVAAIVLDHKKRMRGILTAQQRAKLEILDKAVDKLRDHVKRENAPWKDQR